jgi:hypothetical protein
MASEQKTLFKAPRLVTEEPKPLGRGDLWAGRARAVGQGLFSLGDEAEAALRAAAGEDYSTALADIRRKYAQYKTAEPVISTGIELGTGLASSLIPVAGIAGRIPMAVRALKTTAPLASRVRAALPAIAPVVGQGALAGGISGFGAGEGGLENRLATGAVGAGLGGALGAAIPAAGATGRYAADVYRAARGRVPPERALEQAQKIVSRAAERGQATPRQLYARALRDEDLGSPAVMAQLNPELMSLAETVAQSPSAGRRELVEEIAGQQVSAPEKYKAAIQTAIPSPDYFARQDQVMAGLRTRANNLYEKAYEQGDVRDPALLGLLDNPDVQKAFQDASLNSERLAAAAKARGEDASKYALKPIYDPILDVQGNLVGAQKTGEAPDVRTLDFVKQALDRRISSLYAGGQGGEATALKEMRDAMVERLDDIAPDYKTARKAYAGDIEVANALELGRNELPNIRWQEVKQLWSGKKALSSGEKEAAKTGLLQHLLEPAEDATGSRNFAQRVIGSEDWRNKLQTVLDPKEYRVLDKALRRQSELFTGRSQLLGGSATARRVASKEDLDAAISAGDVNTIADVISRGRNGFLGAGIAALDYARRANVSDAVYTQVARILKTKGPAEIAQTLRDLRDAAARRAVETQKRIGKQQKIAGGAAAAIGPASGEGVDTAAPEQPFALRVPTFEEEPAEEPTMAPSPDLQ